MKKAIHKAFGNLKGMDNKFSDLINQEHVSILKEVEAVTLAAFESLLSLISGPKIPPKKIGLSLISKLIRSKLVAYEEDERETNEFEKVDAALTTILSHRTNIQNQLKELESSIQDLKEGLESLSRRLIKAGVSLLNILNY